MRTLHWLTACLLGLIYATAWSVDGAGSRDEALRLVMMHRSFGLCVLLLTAYRLGLRQVTRLPALPSNLGRPQRLAARGTAFLLYDLALAQPPLGLLASQLHGDHIRVFGVLEIPLWLSTDRAMSRQAFALHGGVAIALLAVLALHVMAALHHHYIRRDMVLRHMLPSWRGPDIGNE